MANLDDMQYLHQCEAVYHARLADLTHQIAHHPHISDKFVTYKQIEEKYDFAFNLMQHRFDLSGRASSSFQEGYLSYIQKNFALDSELEYTLTRYFGRFLGDYLGYLSDQDANTNVLFTEIAQRLKEEGKLSKDIAAQIVKIEGSFKKLDAVKDKTALQTEINSMSDKLNGNILVRKTAEILHAEKAFLDMRVVDTVLRNQNLKELWITNRYQYWFEVLRKPLSAQKFADFHQAVLNPYLVEHIGQMQSRYENVANDGKAYQQPSYANIPLKDSKNGEKLLKALLSPYKGKVIYIDFWGSWCSPCRRDLKMVNAFKQKIVSKDVIFMYFANRSPEDTWRNLISEFHLSGLNTVHHRLPDDQEALLERYLGVTTFPTYMLVDKKGNVINKKATSPTNADYTAASINELFSRN